MTLPNVTVANLNEILKEIQNFYAMLYGKNLTTLDKDSMSFFL